MTATAKVHLILATGMLAVAGYYFAVPAGNEKSATPTANFPLRARSSEAERTHHSVTETTLQKKSDFGSEAWLHSLENLALQEPHQALAKLAAIQEPELLQQALTAVAKGWASLDPNAAAQWVAGLNADQQTSAALGLIPIWAAAHPEDCCEWASQRPAGNLKEIALVEVADAWTASDPRAAWQRFFVMKSEQGSERGLHTIVSQWVLDAPQTAIEHLANLNESARRDEFLETALVSLSNQDPALTWKHANRFSDPATVEHVRSMALEAIAETRPQEALQLAKSAGNSSKLLSAIARGWLAKDAAAARAWLGTLENPGLVAAIQGNAPH